MIKKMLRALEPTDIDFLYQLENERGLWEVSETQLPFAKHLLQQYLLNATQDIYEAKQFRFVIAAEDDSPVGCVDLYDFCPQHKRALVGIAILPNHRGKGYATKALTALIAHVRGYLDIHQLVAYIPADNKVSNGLFQKVGFMAVATLPDWLYSKGTYKAVEIYRIVI
ncbi:GNAT family N-acetyltransferase [Capnocytophaga leadbetteri]|uniref:GNAT family N-acetyltransferase n=1 Tax=Capnocytophaga leadbetteri TaxID=327575 RepID=UPI0028F16BC8|nr:GNAT family N-acetyltransferase [Capnocytophaga leadbetteri]